MALSFEHNLQSYEVDIYGNLGAVGGAKMPFKSGMGHPNNDS